jgi:hypothetical protein
MRALGVILLALVVLPVAAGSPSRTARITVTNLSPVTVHGTRFVGGERVTVVFSLKTRHVHRLRATAAGTFTTRFTAVTIDRCTAYAVQATGSSGSTAFLKVVPQCPPPD